MIQATLGEGDTPLVPSTRIAKRLGMPRLFFKLESLNPSGSYKDRFIASEVTRMLNQHATGFVATSSGNTGSSLATYCARYGLACVIAVNDDAPDGKLQQMLALGARILKIRGFIRSSQVTGQVFQVLARLATSHRIPLVVSAYRYCPEGMTGVESISRELIAQCPHTIDHVFVPVGGGGLFSAVCRGFAKQAASSSHAPRVHAVQPEGCSTVAASFARGDDRIAEVRSTTCVSGLAVPFDIDGELALAHLRECGGRAYALPDADIFCAQKMLIELEGIYCEPAGAAALAGLLVALRDGTALPGDTAICLVTGHGFKDPKSIATHAAGNVAACIGADEVEDHVLRNIRTCR